MKTTRIWHGIDLVIGIYAVKKNPSLLNWVRLGFALIGLGGNVVIAMRDKDDSSTAT